MSEAIETVSAIKFSDKYTTQTLIDAGDDPKGKIIISDDSYSTGEQLEKVNNSLNVLGFRIGRFR